MLRRAKISLFVLISLIILSSSHSAQGYGNTGSFLNVQNTSTPYSTYEGKIVFLEAIQTDCHYCNDPNHQSQMKSLYVAYASQITFLVISINTADTLDDMDNFVRKWSIDATVGLDQDNSLGNVYGIKSTPTMLLLNPDGSLIKPWVGVQKNVETYAATINNIVTSQVNTFSSNYFSGAGGDNGPSVLEKILTNPLVLGGLGIFVLLTIYFRITGPKAV